MKLEPLGDSAVVATLGSAIDDATLASVLSLSEAILAEGKPGVTDVVPAYVSVTAFYDPEQFSQAPGDAYGEVCRFLESCAGKAAAGAPAHRSRHVEIPVCYAGDFAPDMGVVAAHSGLTTAEVIEMHSGAEYRVHAIGFTPGFPYLGGLPERLRTPRRDTPRAHVPAGAVAIGGLQTGVYPVDSPGGWQIIGRTHTALFRPLKKPASLLRPGDTVRFTQITVEEFKAWR